MKIYIGMEENLMRSSFWGHLNNSVSWYSFNLIIYYVPIIFHPFKNTYLVLVMLFYFFTILGWGDISQARYVLGLADVINTSNKNYNRKSRSHGREVSLSLEYREGFLED